jgi:hypothetical protein
MSLLVGLPESSGVRVRSFPGWHNHHHHRHGWPCLYITQVMNNKPVGVRDSDTYVSYNRLGNQDASQAVIWLRQLEDRPSPRVRAYLRPRGICGGHNDTGTGFFSEMFCFPFHDYSGVAVLLIPSWGWTIAPLLAAVQRHSLTPSTRTTTARSVSVSTNIMQTLPTRIV